MSTAQAFFWPSFGIYQTPRAPPCNSPSNGISSEQIMFEKTNIDLIAAVIGVVTTI